MHGNLRSGSQSGITMIELLTAMALVAVLSAIGIPSLRNLTLQQRVRDTAQQLQLDIAYARSEAITRADTVTVCTSDTGLDCTSAAWQTGWMIFVDSNANGSIDKNETVIRQASTPIAGVTISPTPNVNLIVINSRGRAAANLLLSVCKTGLKGRDLSIRTSGNPSISVPAGLCS